MAQAPRGLEPREHGQVDGVVVVRPRSERRVQDNLFNVDAVDGEGSPIVNLFWVESPVLSVQRMSTPAELLDGDESTDNGLLSGEQAAPTAIVTDNTVGIATGMAATVSTSANCSVVRNGSPRISETTMMMATIAIAR